TPRAAALATAAHATAVGSAGVRAAAVRPAGVRAASVRPAIRAAVRWTVSRRAGVWTRVRAGHRAAAVHAVRRTGAVAVAVRHSVRRTISRRAAVRLAGELRQQPAAVLTTEPAPPG